VKDILDGLNRDQVKAVTQLKGATLVVGGAGCGKTKVILAKIAYIFQKRKVKPEEIFVLTYSKLSAVLYIDQLVELGVDRDVARRINFLTFYELGLRILRGNPEICGLKPNFSIYDEKDQLSIIERACQEIKVDKKLTPDIINHRIIQAKARMIGEESFLESMSSIDEEDRISVEKIYHYYNEFLRRHNGVDYEDIINYSVRILEEDGKFRRSFLRKIKFLFVDEYQDITLSQYALVKNLVGKSTVFTAVANDDQCVVEGTFVDLEDGKRLIEDIKKDDKVIAACGGSSIGCGVVESVKSRPYSSKVVRVLLERGKEVRLTPNHIVFAKFDIYASQSYVYLMHRPGIGYRIGTCQGLSIFLEPKKMDQQEGDRFWILSVHDSVSEANFYEVIYSGRYGLPVVPFSIPGNSLKISNEQLKRIFEEIDTVSRAELLMEDLNIFEEYPHYVSVARTSGDDNPRVLNVTMFGNNERDDEDEWYSHRVSIDTRGVGNSRLQQLSRKKRDEWIVDATRRDYSEIMHFARTLSSIDNLMIVERARLTSKGSFFQIPASHLRKSMMMPVMINGKIEEIRIKDIVFEDYDGFVYDLSVAHLHNFVASDVIVHNSINSWKGSDLLPMVNFSRDFKPAIEVKLERNYRSTKNIVWSSNELVRNNINRIEKNVWTERDEGEKIVCYQAINEQDEVYYVINQMRQIVFKEEKQYKNFAFFFRAYAQVKILEDVLKKEGIPYTIAGDNSMFFDKEVKDVLSYLKVLVNHYGNFSILRILNVPRRGIGDKSIVCLEEYSKEVGEPIWECLGRVNEIEGLPLKSKNTILNFKDLMGDLARDIERFSISEYIDEVIERTGYHSEIKCVVDPSREAETPLTTFLRFAREYEKENPKAGLSEFLEEISIIDRQSSIDLEANSVFLLPIHETKGLEFPVIFILGMEEGVFPNDAPSLYYFDLEEERRALYQAMTRAKERIFLINAKVRRIFGSVFENCPSRFIQEIPEELVISLDSELLREKQVEEDLNRAEEMKHSPQVDDEYGITFSPGDRVKHSMWGIGNVVESVGEGDDLMVTVDFMNAGIKKLLIKYAPLERI
jgi:DNA helicase-2/ATP-dependent DNA helicase PcrA